MVNILKTMEIAQCLVLLTNRKSFRVYFDIICEIVLPLYGIVSHVRAGIEVYFQL